MDVLNYKTRNITIRYLIVLSLIALFSVSVYLFTQFTLSRHVSDAPLINLSGRQRMLSQKLAKEVLLLAQSPTIEMREQYREMLRATLGSWSRVHRGLQHGDEQLQLPGNNSPEIRALFRKMESYYHTMKKGVNSILTLKDNDFAVLSSKSTIVSDIVNASPLYLKWMDRAVFQYDKESQERVNNLKWFETYIMGLTFLLLLLATLFVFRPMVARVRITYENYQRANEELRRHREQLEKSVDERTAELMSTNIALRQEISERKEIEKALRNSQQNYASLVNTIEGIVWEADALTFQFSFVSQQAERLLGYPMKRWLTDQTFWKDHIYPDDQSWAIAYCEKAVKEKRAHEFEYRMIDKEGGIIWLRDIVTVVVENDQPVKLRGIMVDITEHKRTELLQSALYRIATIAHSDTSLKKLFHSIHEVVTDIMDAGNFYIALYDSQKDLLTFPYFVDEVDTYEGPYKPQNGLTEYIIQTGETLLLNEEDRNRLINEGKITPVGEPSRVWLGVPLKSSRGTFGAIVVQHYRDVNAIGEREKEMLTFISEQIAIVIERKQAEEEVKKLSEVVEQSSDIVFITDVKGKIEYVNPAFEKITGYSQEEAIGQTPRILKSGKMSAEYYKNVWETIQSGKVMHTEVIDRKKNGELFIYDQTITPMKDSEGNIAGFISTGSDISERVKSRKKLEKALEKAKEGERVKSLFLANMSHEIRTPLNAILGFTDLIEASTRNLVGDEEQGFFKTIRNSGNRLMRTVHEILDISQIEAGTYDLKMEDLEISNLVRSIMRECQPIAESKSLRLEFKTDLDSAFIHADRYGVSQAIRNLIDNAIKFTEKGKITVSLKRESGNYLLTVQDTGIGISAEYLDSLFEAFSQESEGYTKKFQGIGLGMAIAKRHLDLNHVDINIESVKGIGTTFTLTFKSVNRSVAKKQVAIEKNKVTSTLEPDEKPLVLVVEDDPNSQKLTEYFLRDMYNVCFATTVEEAKRRLKKYPVRSVLLDLSLDGNEDGLDLVRWMRKTKTWYVTPVIAATAHALIKDRDNCLAAGCNDYLAKPVKREKLLEKINAFV
jgi:PAS domain S-box-containing protein